MRPEQANAFGDNLAPPLVVYLALGALAIASGFSFDFGPTVFIADFEAYLVLPVLVFAWINHGRPTHTIAIAVVLALILFVGLAIVSDLYNRTPDLLRGFLRNISVIGLALGIMQAGKRYGLALATTLWLLIRLSQAISGLPEYYSGTLSLPDYIKYNGAAALGLAPLLVIRSNLLAGCLTLVIGAAQFFLFDTRGGGLVFCMAGLIIIFWEIGSRLGRALAFALTLFAAAAILFAAYYAFIGNMFTRNVVRAESSNEMRMLMMRDSWEMFLNRPVLGNGSLSQGDRFLDALDKRSTMSVHSIALQWLGEYGLIGGMMIVASIVAAIAATSRTLYLGRLIPPPSTALLILAATEIGGLLCLNVFSGYARIRFGISLGLCLALLEFRPFSQPASKRP